MSPILVLFILGIVGLIVGALAMWRLRVLGSAQLPRPPRWRALRILATLTGLALGAGSFFLMGSMWLSYPLAGPGGIGHVFGIPFFAAYIDAQGSDYVGGITWISAAANFVFWFVVPQIALWFYVTVWRRSARLGAQHVPQSSH